MSQFDYIAVLVSVVVGSAVAARSSSHRVHATWGILFFAIMSAFEYANFSVLGAR